MSRRDLTDVEWRVIEPLLPNELRDVPRVDDRCVLNGIFWVLQWCTVTRRSAMAPTHHLLQPLRAMAEGRRMGIG